MPRATWTILFFLPACLLAFGGCARSVDPESLRAFQEAQKTFDAAATPDDFLKAAALYQGILDRGVVSGAVLYNQGNALMRAGQRGRAIAAYRQAQRYRPRDPYLDANLRYALGAVSPAERRRPVIEYLLFWQNWLGYTEKFILAGAVVAITLGLGLGAVFFSRRRLKRLALAGAAVCLVAIFSAAYDWYRYDATTHGVTLPNEVVARKGNGTSYEPALSAALPEGTEFELLGRRGGWLLVRMAGGQEGWLPEEAVALY
jgi:tetratricopeptide (TPR) repeat protein